MFSSKKIFGKLFSIFALALFISIIYATPTFAISTSIDLHPDDPNQVVEDARFITPDKFYSDILGKYPYPANSDGEIEMFLIFPNNNGSSWAQGNVNIYDEFNKKIGTVLISNLSSEFVKITWSQLEPDKSYSFSYSIGRIGKEKTYVISLIYITKVL